MSNRITRQSDSRDSDTNRRAFTFALNSCYRGHVCCSSLACAAAACQSSSSSKQPPMQAMHQEKQVARTLTDNWARPRSLISFLALVEAVGAAGAGAAVPLLVRSRCQCTFTLHKSRRKKARVSNVDSALEKDKNTLALILYYIFFGELAFERNLGL